jgi:hypothetical protein
MAVFAGTLDRLLAVLDAAPQVAVIGPKLVRPDGSFATPRAGCSRLFSARPRT